jgi:predicted transcriptional regulator
VRFSNHLDERLDRLSVGRAATKQALVVRAVEEYLMRERKTEAVLDSIDETSRDYVGLIRRLEDA